EGAEVIAGKALLVSLGGHDFLFHHAAGVIDQEVEAIGEGTHVAASANRGVDRGEGDTQHVDATAGRGSTDFGVRGSEARRIIANTDDAPATRSKALGQLLADTRARARNQGDWLTVPLAVTLIVPTVLTGPTDGRHSAPV